MREGSGGAEFVDIIGTPGLIHKKRESGKEGGAMGRNTEKRSAHMGVSVALVLLPLLLRILRLLPLSSSLTCCRLAVARPCNTSLICLGGNDRNADF